MPWHTAARNTAVDCSKFNSVTDLTVPNLLFLTPQMYDSKLLSRPVANSSPWSN